jgi:sRNA-binding regulator protein Hfq
MSGKVWYKTEISLDADQNVEIYFDEGYGGIVIKGKEIESTDSYRIYLNRAEMELLISKMREMMDHVEKP